MCEQCSAVFTYLYLSQLKLGNKLKTNSEPVAAGTQYGEPLRMASYLIGLSLQELIRAVKTCIKAIGDGQTIDHLVTNLVKTIVFSPL